ncbi:alpha/beta hydrolase [Peristeroidobacter soli]|uniref:alpha/beta hydrolase n=1 Tax=Peristeroidobacter soli TaxID=2497877 RepID=UPI00101DE804|nr:alpha/beta hydrolase [Peristeroidobacter soli]
MYELVQNIANGGESTVTSRGKVEFGAWLGAVTVALHFAAPAARADVTAETAAAPVLEDRYPRAKVSFGSDVESHPDVIYSTQPGFRPLRLDIYRQVAPKGPRPLVVYIHGGGWISGHTRHSGAFANWPAVLASLARKGYVVVSVEYRLSSEAKFPAAIQDVKNAIKWLRANAAKYSVDPQKTVVWGGSAGGQLAALAATTCGVEALEPETGDKSVASQSDCVQGLVAWYGVFDFNAIPPPPPGVDDAVSAAGKYLGCAPAQCADKVALASPISHIDAKDPPTLLIHGEMDKVVAVGQSRSFDAALRAKGVASELVVIPAVDHSFIGGSPEATRQASLQALAKTFEFIDAVLGGQRK